MNCKICDHSARLFGKGRILDKHLVEFYQCPQCGFMQTEQPYWLDEAYSSAITKSDIGLIGRNLQMMDVTKKLILMCFDPAGKFIDYGGGYGVFVRLMRDQGFDFFRHDPLCENLFAAGFEAQATADYELLTAWEVFEHLIDPIAEVKKMLEFSENILFSTLLLPKTPQPIGSWWYYGLEHGQHVSFLNAAALQIVAKKLGLKVQYSDGFIHLLGKKNISPFLIRIATGKHLGVLRKIISKRAPSSLLQRDFETLTGISLK
jgi:hypothetical protein